MQDTKPLQVGTPVKFVGYPSYKQGLIGYISKLSTSDPSSFHVTFKNGTWMVTDIFQVEILE